MFAPSPRRVTPASRPRGSRRGCGAGRGGPAPAGRRRRGRSADGGRLRRRVARRRSPRWSDGAGLDAVQLHGRAGPGAPTRCGAALGRRAAPATVAHHPGRARARPTAPTPRRSARGGAPPRRAGADLLLFDTQVRRPVRRHRHGVPLVPGPGSGRRRPVPGGRRPRPRQRRGRPWRQSGAVGSGRIERGGESRRASKTPTAAALFAALGGRAWAPRRRIRSGGLAKRRPRRTQVIGRKMTVTTPHRFGPYGGRYVPETLVSALEELDEAYETLPRRPGVPRRAPHAADRLRRPADAALPAPTGCPSAPAAASTSSGRTWPTPARTRSTTPSARSCSPRAWARSASSPRPAPGSTAWPRPRWPRSSAWSATSTWARRTSAARSSTCSACGCWAPRCCR